MQLKCSTCGELFQALPYEVNQRSFCSTLCSGATKSESLIGYRFGKLFVIADAPDDVVFVGTAKEKRFKQYVCKCDCTNHVMVRQHSLCYRNVKSCGCARVKHGHSLNNTHSPTYKTWVGMWARCTNPNTTDFEIYGGRGIVVCDEWKTFERFLNDMGVKPIGTSIDRIDVNGGYNPLNCRWATAQQQQSNKRSNRIVVYQGIKDTLTAHCRRLSLSRGMVNYRLNTGWPIEAAFEQQAQVGKSLNERTPL